MVYQLIKQGGNMGASSLGFDNRCAGAFGPAPSSTSCARFVFVEQPGQARGRATSARAAVCSRARCSKS